jgi:hypothetical protein
MSTATFTRIPAMAGKSTTRAPHLRRARALPSHVRPARSVAPRSSRAAPAVGRAREAIHRGPIENSRRVTKARTDSAASARAKPGHRAARAKAALVVARVVWAVASVAAAEVVGQIDLAPEQGAPADSVAVASAALGGGDKRENRFQVFRFQVPGAGRGRVSTDK